MQIIFEKADLNRLISAISSYQAVQDSVPVSIKTCKDKKSVNIIVVAAKCRIVDNIPCDVIDPGDVCINSSIFDRLPKNKSKVSLTFSDGNVKVESQNFSSRIATEEASIDDATEDKFEPYVKFTAVSFSTVLGAMAKWPSKDKGTLHIVPKKNKVFFYLFSHTIGYKRDVDAKVKKDEPIVLDVDSYKVGDFLKDEDVLISANEKALKISSGSFSATFPKLANSDDDEAGGGSTEDKVAMFTDLIKMDISSSFKIKKEKLEGLMSSIQSVSENLVTLSIENGKLYVKSEIEGVAKSKVWTKAKGEEFSAGTWFNEINGALTVTAGDDLEIKVTEKACIAVSELNEAYVFSRT